MPIENYQAFIVVEKPDGQYMRIKIKESSLEKIDQPLDLEFHLELATKKSSTLPFLNKGRSADPMNFSHSNIEKQFAHIPLKK